MTASSRLAARAHPHSRCYLEFGNEPLAIEQEGEEGGSDDSEKHRDVEPEDTPGTAECEKEAALQILRMLVVIDQLIRFVHIRSLYGPRNDR